MAQCPITYEQHFDGGPYSRKGLRYISTGLHELLPAQLATMHPVRNRRDQQVYPALLSPTVSRFVASGDKHPSYYLFGDSSSVSALPANMDVSLRIAALFGLQTPLHGLLHTDQGGWVMFVKNPAAYSKNRFYAVEGIRSLAAIGHQQHIDLETVADVISAHTSFPLVEKIALLKLAIAVFLLGDSSFGPDQLTILDERGKKYLTPITELANMNMYGGERESHLRLAGKTGPWTGADLIDGFARSTLALPGKSIDKVIQGFKSGIRPVFALIETCYLPDEWKEEYLLTIDNRWSDLGF